MADYAVLYHDPVRLTLDENAFLLAAQSVWVYRNDRFAFEIHVYGLRDEGDSHESLSAHGEGRYRLALAILGGRHAKRAAADRSAKTEPIVVYVDSKDIREVLASIPAVVAVVYGDFIYRFKTTDLSQSARPLPVTATTSRGGGTRETALP